VTSIHYSIEQTRGIDMNNNPLNHISSDSTFTEAQVFPQHLAYTAFAAVATVTKLTNHGRNFEVFLNGRSLGFADGVCKEDALRQAHKREVNNALWVNNEDVPEFARIPIPSWNALQEYPDLQGVFPKAWNLVAAPAAATLAI
jgi:hypothetical protein